MGATAAEEESGEKSLMVGNRRRGREALRVRNWWCWS